MRFPELVETIRRIDSVRWARGGYVYSVTIRLSDGRRYATTKPGATAA